MVYKDYYYNRFYSLGNGMFFKCLHPRSFYHSIALYRMTDFRIMGFWIFEYRKKVIEATPAELASESFRKRMREEYPNDPGRMVQWMVAKLQQLLSEEEK